jgi:muramoyltetrapeptide carboxypeptidase LdcA involved in peptidoglycan recycling
VSGRLIGGCWDTLIHLFGTEYCDLKGVKQASDEGVLLFLENAEMSPQALTRAIVSMRTRGVFEQVSGLMLGRNSAMDNPALSYKKVVDKQLKHLGIPVAMGLDIGHLPPNLTLINGSAATLEIGASNQIVQALI